MNSTFYKNIAHFSQKLCHRHFLSQKHIKHYSTIFAQASSPGKAGVSVIRISGPETKNVIQKMIRSLKNEQCTNSIAPRTALLKKLVNPSKKNDVLDIALVIWFPAPRSYTGEDILELHLHGSNIVVKNTLEALQEIKGCRLAEPGEFSKRAFYNSKMDLTEIEGLADLINAETEAQRIQALSQAQGKLRILYEGWRSDIISAMANVETVLEFSEEESIDSGLFDQAQDTIKKTFFDISKHLSDKNKGEIVRNGLKIALIGPPNVGKSSIINHFAKRSVAIVSPIAGTTRDIIEISTNIGGYQVVISDTAGICHSSNEIEKQGIELAIERAKDAQIKFIVLDTCSIINSEFRTNYFKEFRIILNNISKTNSNQLLDENTYFIINKSDLTKAHEKTVDLLIDLLCSELCVQKSQLKNKIWTISCKTGKGWDTMLSNLNLIITKMLQTSAQEPVFLTRERHRQNLVNAAMYLKRFLESVVESAEELRFAANSIGKITGGNRHLYT
ncbi:hypothetical protein BB561_002239 [Smittium simulii]|uniref:TrmE-type G domain-containing protein n=1 Tax=Smittium simulii TaxID=133385 RepID=A0A2T9YR48_9FUNG|nr:hypothetical protein BB561_002239 [Smittium simulii]